jgi:serine/threonine-protein kinase HipA
MPLAEDGFTVWLADRKVGLLHRRGDYTWYSMDPDYWKDPERPVLGLAFEDRPGEGMSSALRLPPWFSNLLPEGIVRDWIAQERRVSVHREMELLAQVGHDLPGAVRVLPAEEELPGWAVRTVEQEAGRSGFFSGDSLPQWRFSLAGVGLKFSMLARGDRLTLPVGGTGGDWIVKLPDGAHAGVPRNEYAMMSLASAVGIETPEIRIVRRADLPDLPDRVWSRGEEEAYAIRRFDRAPDGTLVHIEDLAQVRGIYPDEKYRGTFETVASLIFRGYDAESLREFVRRLVFCVLIGNGDAHLKNWSLIYRDSRRPALSPAYDLVATAVYRSAADGPEDLGLKFGRSRRFETVRLPMFQSLQDRLGAERAELVEVARETVRATVSAWPSIAPLLDDHPNIQQSLDRRIAQMGKLLLG